MGFGNRARAIRRVSTTCDGRDSPRLLCHSHSNTTYQSVKLHTEPTFPPWPTTAIRAGRCCTDRARVGQWLPVAPRTSTKNTMLHQHGLVAGAARPARVYSHRQIHHLLLRSPALESVDHAFYISTERRAHQLGADPPAVRHGGQRPCRCLGFGFLVVRLITCGLRSSRRIFEILKGLETVPRPQRPEVDERAHPRRFAARGSGHHSSAMVIPAPSVQTLVPALRFSTEAAPVVETRQPRFSKDTLRRRVRDDGKRQLRSTSLRPRLLRPVRERRTCSRLLAAGTATTTLAAVPRELPHVSM